MKNVLIVWLWWQWQKYVQYFLKNAWNVHGICKTEATKKNILQKYPISISTVHEEIDFSRFDMIVIAVPPEVQWTTALTILESGYTEKMIIEIPVSWDLKEIRRLQSYTNVLFFLEEYYTLLASFLRKSDIESIQNISIHTTVHPDDFQNPLAREVARIHVYNNFLWLCIPSSVFHESFSFHQDENIYYRIEFEYKNKIIQYIFEKEKYLLVGDARFSDPFDFDGVISRILTDTKNPSVFYLPESFHEYSLYSN